MSHHSNKKVSGTHAVITTHPKAASTAVSHSYRPTAKTKKGRRAKYKNGPSLFWLLPLIIGAITILAVFLVLMGGNQISGKLVAEKTVYNFGQVKLNGGLVTTQFLLKAQDDGVLVTKLTTT